MMRALAFLALTALAACGNPSSPIAPADPPQPEPPSPEPPSPSPEPPEAAQSAVAPALFYDDEELAELGYRLEPLEGENARWCRGDGCLCREPLETTMTFDENLRVFREALARGQGEGSERRTVNCLTAETGRCGAFRYFLFVGDIYRHELRWFDADGAMVAWRNVTDYDAYCGGSLARWKGRVPRCEEVERTELICGEGQTVLTPLEDLHALAAGRGPRGAGP